MQATQHPTRQTQRGARRRRGSTLVEFAIVGTLLLIPMLIGIMEFGVLSKNNLLVANATREGARAAAIGVSPAQIDERVNTFMPSMKVSSQCSGNPPGAGETNCISKQMSTDNGATYTTLNVGTSGTGNNAPHGSLVRVMVHVRHTPLTRFFFFMNSRNIQTTVTMRRE